MKPLKCDYTGCPVIVYDEAGNRLCDTTVTYYDNKRLRIEIEDPLANLGASDACRLLILTKPTPCEYKGRIIQAGQRKLIVIFDGKESEKREDSRYTVRLPAFIESYICDDLIYPLHTPLAVEMINISKNGARLLMPEYALSIGDRFWMCVRINNMYKSIIAEVKNQTPAEAEASEYGCRFLLSGDGGVCNEHERAG